MEQVGSFSCSVDSCFQGSEAEQDSLGRSMEPGVGAAKEHDTAGHGSTLEGYDPYSFSKEMDKLDEMSKTPETVKQRFNEYSMRSLLLNADVVTMFDPVSSEELKSVVMSCNQCTDRIAKMQAETIETSRQGQMDTSNNEASGTEFQVNSVTEESDSVLEPMEDNSACSLDIPPNED